MKNDSYIKTHFIALLLLACIVFVILSMRHVEIQRTHIDNETLIAVMELRIAMYKKYKEKNEIKKALYDYGAIYDFYSNNFNFWPAIPTTYGDLEKKSIVFFSQPLFFMELKTNDGLSIYCINTDGCIKATTIPLDYEKQILLLQQDQLQEYMNQNKIYPATDSRKTLTTIMRDSGYLWPQYFDHSWNYSAWSTATTYLIKAQNDQTSIECSNNTPCSIIENK